MTILIKSDKDAIELVIVGSTQPGGLGLFLGLKKPNSQNQKLLNSWLKMYRKLMNFVINPKSPEIG